MLHHSATAKQYCASSSTVARIRNQKVATGHSFNGQLEAGFTSVLLLVRDVISPKLAPHPLLAIPAQRNPHVNQSVATAIAKHVQKTFGRMKPECPSPFVSFLAQLGFPPSGDHGQRFGRTSSLGSLRRGLGRPTERQEARLSGRGSGEGWRFWLATLPLLTGSSHGVCADRDRQLDHLSGVQMTKVHAGVRRHNVSPTRRIAVELDGDRL